MQYQQVLRVAPDERESTKEKKTSGFCLQLEHALKDIERCGKNVYYGIQWAI